MTPGWSSLGVMPMSDGTRILPAINQGDPRAAGQLLPLVYDELRQLAARKLAFETPGQTLQPTAVVHGLIEAARRKQLPRHGGGQLRWAEVRDMSGTSEAPCSDNVVA